MSAAVIAAPPAMAERGGFTLEVYSKPSCVQCTGTYRALDRKSIAYTKPMLDAGELREFGTSLGLAQAPVVVVRAADGSVEESWGGFNPLKIDEWAARLPSSKEASTKKTAETIAA